MTLTYAAVEPHTQNFIICIRGVFLMCVFIYCQKRRGCDCVRAWNKLIEKCYKMRITTHTPTPAHFPSALLQFFQFFFFWCVDLSFSFTRAIYAESIAMFRRGNWCVSVLTSSISGKKRQFDWNWIGYFSEFIQQFELLIRKKKK